MSGSETESGLSFAFLHVGQLLYVRWATVTVRADISFKILLDNPRQTCQALQYQILASDRSSLVETTDVDPTSKWDPERFGTKNGFTAGNE
jgi:hypothetical protein